jgi:hypothetical protein
MTLDGEVDAPTWRSSTLLGVSGVVRISNRPAA